MRGMARKLRDGLIAASVAGALGMGAAAAYARPAEGGGGAAACNPTSCNAMCEGRFGPFASGECWGEECVCAI